MSHDGSPAARAARLFARESDDENVTDIWSVDVDGSDLCPVTQSPAGYGFAWLPADGA
jgi:hypothetical protein